MKQLSQDRLAKRLLQLERQVFDLRRQLGGDREPRPEQAFDALEVSDGESWYLVPIRPIREVVAMVWPRPLPDSPEWVLGTFRYGDAVVPLVDLRRRLRGQGLDCEPSLRVVVTDEPKWLALVVSKVRSVVRVDPEVVAEPSEGISQAPFLLGTVNGDDGDSRHLLSIERLGREFIFAEEPG